MIDLPSTTLFNKKVKKELFYEKLNITPAIKQAFVEQIKVIFWKNKIAPATTNHAVVRTTKRTVQVNYTFSRDLDKYDMMDNVDLPNDSGNAGKWRIWMPIIGRKLSFMPYHARIVIMIQ